MSRIGGPLDRYVFAEWTKIFVSTALGLPILLIIIDLTDHLQRYLDRNIPRSDIAMSYVYWIPESMFLAMPASVLFATVFSIGSFTRFSEVTAAKASGVSFYRLIAPILFGAFLAAGLDYVVGEAAPITSARRAELLGESKVGSGTQRTNFAYAGEYGRVYKPMLLDVTSGTMDRVQIERKGGGPDYPTLFISAANAAYKPETKRWTLRQGEMHVISDTASDLSIGFSEMHDKHLDDIAPGDFMGKAREPAAMRFAELSRFIRALERSGGDANLLRVERALKLAIPVTCLVIALFGAPLATSSQRGGTAYGIGISLATTITFLMLVQLTKAIGAKNVIWPDVAAWIPSAVFALVGITLLARVRT